MNNKIIKTFILVVLLTLLVGLVSASEVSPDTTSTPTGDISADTVVTDTTPSLVEDTTPTTTGEIQESVTSKQIENKEITKEEKNKKTANPINVRTYTDLKNAFDRKDAVVIVNITANITLQDSPSLSSWIKSLTIEGNGFTLNGSGQHRLLGILSGTNVNINNITITNCHRDEDGGAIINYYGGTLKITDSNLTHNSATNDGGAIYNNGVLNIMGSNLNYNIATNGGAIINKEDGTLNIIDSNLTDNTATGTYGGGAIYNNNGRVNCTGSTFDMNSPSNYIINNEKQIQLENNDNYIPEDATYTIYLDDEKKNPYTGSLDNYVVPKNHKIRLIVNGSDTNAFSDNTFILYSYNKVVTNYTELVNAVNDAKQSTQDEYSINLYPGDYNATESITWADASGNIRKLIINGNGLTLNGSTINERFITIESGYALILENMTLTQYKDDYAGAIRNYGTLTITNSNLNYNTANNNGGAIYNNGTLNITNSNLTHNTANNNGGAIYNTGGGIITITDSNFTHNIANLNGGAIYSEFANVVCTGSTFDMNSPSNYIINNEKQIQLENNDNYIPEDANYTIYLDDEEKNPYTGSLDNYVVPKNHKIRLIVNGSDTNAFSDNTFILYSYNKVVTNYTELVNAVNDAKQSTQDEYSINLYPGDYNATESITWADASGNIRKLIINGNGLTLNGSTINGRFMYIEPEYTLILENITLTNYIAHTGAAIYNSGTLNITHSNLIHNSATNDGGAIFSEGNLNIADSYLNYNNATVNGGAIENMGHLNITNSNLTHNTATNDGGAIYNAYGGTTLTITNSNINYNKAKNGGAIYNGYRSSTLTIADSYLNYNKATNDGGAIYNNGTINISNSNLTHNNATKGGLIYNNATLNITDSNLTHNNATDAYGGTIYNEDGGRVICTGSTFDMNTPANYIISKENEPHKIQLYSDDGFITTNEDNVVIYLDNNETSNYTGRLSDYNVTKGHKIRLTVNGTDTTTFRDNTFILYSYDNIVTNYIQLVEAVNEAKKSYEDEYHIYLFPGDYNATRDIDWDDATGSTRKLTIYGNNVTIDGTNIYFSFMNVFTNYALTLKNITLTNFKDSWGGALYNSFGNLTIIDSNLINNNAIFGGAIHNDHGNVTIINSNLTHNTATYDGGVIRNWGNITIINSNFNYNSANRDGGAIYHSVSGNSTLNITNSNFTNNSAKDGNGAAIYNMSGGVVCTGSTFYNNTPLNYIVTQNNGQYYLKLNKTDDFINMDSVKLFVDDERTPLYSGSNLDEYCLPAGNHKITLVVNGSDSAQFNNNTFIIESQLDTDNFNVSDYKGLVYAVDYAKTTSYDNYTINLLPGNYNATRSMSWEGASSNTHKLIINGNNITLDGLKRYQFMFISSDYNLTLNNITLTHYNATDGGAIHNRGNVTIINSTLKNNTATYYGGAIYNQGNLNITDSNLTHNSATEDGGAIHNWGNLTITNSNLTHNSANRDGGAIYNNYGGTFNINNSNLNFNNVTGLLGYGGAIYNEEGTFNITDSNLTHNSATEDGGAIYSRTLVTTSKILIDNTKFTQNSLTFKKYKKATLTLNLTSNIFNDTTFNINNTDEEDYINVYVAENKFDKSNGCLIDSIEGLPREINGFNDDYEYNDEFRSYLIEGNKNYKTTNLTITTDEDNPYINDTITITVTLKDIDAMGIGDKNISITVNDQDICNITTTNGIATTTLSFNESRANTIKAQFLGDKDYNPSNNTITVNSQKLPTKITATLTNNIIRNTTIIVLVTDTHNNKKVTTGQIEVYDNNKKVGNATINPTGTTTINLDVKTKDLIELNIKYLENDYYTNSTYEISDVVIVGRLSQIDLIDNNVTYQNTSINITVKDSVTNTNIPDAPVTITLSNGTTINTNTGSTGTVNVPLTLPLGKNTINLEYTGNDEYNMTTTTHTITVTPRQSTTTAKTLNNTYNNTTISITIKDTTTGRTIKDAQVTITLPDGKAINTNTGSTGTATVPLTLPVGSQKINIKYNGNDEYNTSNTTLSINVEKRATTTTATINNKTAGNNTITIKVTDKTTKQPVTSGQVEIINKATNKVVAKATISSINTTVTTTLNESGTYNLTVKYLGNDYYQTSQCAVNNLNIQKRIATLTVKTVNNTLNNTMVNITLTDSSTGKTIPNAQVTIKLPNGTTVSANTGTTGTVIQKITLPTGKNTINVTYTGSKTYNTTSKNHTIDVKKLTTKTTITPLTAYLGDKITLKATVTAENNIKINEGNVIFKINGVTIKDNGKLTGSDNPLKIKVANGAATATITADSSMKNAAQITAHYIENTDYTASNSTPAKITLKTRTATITVTTNTKTIKQGQNLTITAKITDTTSGKKINTTADEYVYFKINGITLKDANGEMLKAKVVNGIATIKYTIPLGLSCVTDTQSMTPKNQTILAVFYSKNYPDDTKNTTTFQVERSNITITLSNATINNKTHTLSMKITIKDYLGNTVSGPNKLIIKVNGVTLKNGTEVMYFYTTDGILNLKNAPVPKAKNYTSVDVITQDRLAYKSQRNTTKIIKVTN